MSNSLIFTVVFVGFFVARIIVATIVFFWILPRGDRCPNCDGVTLRVQSKGWNTVMPWFRTSWCYRCNWEGLLRTLTPPSETARVAGQHAASRRSR